MEMANKLRCDLAAEVVGTFGEIRLRVFGTSMVPSIFPGDLISVQRAVVSEVSSGEIVLYARDGRMFMHRVVACTGSPEHSLLIARGDRLRHSDPPVSSPELIGRVTRIERGPTRIPVPSCLNLAGRAICHLLRFSDRATYVYLHFASRRSEFFPWRAVCRP
jgi:signal peptidase I